jgi:hypothetical protein
MKSVFTPFIAFLAIPFGFSPEVVPSMEEPVSVESMPVEDCECLLLRFPGPNVGAGGGSWGLTILEDLDGECLELPNGTCPESTTPCKISIKLAWTPPAQGGVCPGGPYSIVWGNEDGDEGGLDLGTKTPFLKKSLGCSEVYDVRVQCLVGGVMTTVADFRFWCTDCGLVN